MVGQRYNNKDYKISLHLPYSRSTRLLSHVCRVTSEFLVLAWTGMGQCKSVGGNCGSLAGQTRTRVYMYVRRTHTYESLACETSSRTNLLLENAAHCGASLSERLKSVVGFLQLLKTVLFL